MTSLSLLAGRTVPVSGLSFMSIKICLVKKKTAEVIHSLHAEIFFHAFRRRFVKPDLLAKLRKYFFFWQLNLFGFCLQIF